MNPEDRDRRNPDWCYRHDEQLRLHETQLKRISDSMESLVKDVGEIKVQVALIPAQLGETLARIDEKLAQFEKRDFVTRAEFDPIKRLVYGVVGIVLVAFVTALTTLVFARDKEAGHDRPASTTAAPDQPGSAGGR